MTGHVPRSALDATALFRLHAPYVANLVRRLGADADEVEDLVQEIFLTAHRRGGYVPGPARPTTWLAGIAVRIVANRRRERRRQPDLDDDLVAAAASQASSPYEVLLTARSLSIVKRALDRLDLEHRAVFVLFEIEGESCAAIAEALQIPVGTVHSRLHHARRAVQKSLDRYEAERPPGSRSPRREERTP